VSLTKHRVITTPNKQIGEIKMAQRKETKKIKVRDLKPKKDAKGGFFYQGPTGGKNPTGAGHHITGPTGQK
jgi:hypothetical protein